MGGGLALSTRKWYCEQILKAMKLHGGKASLPTIMWEMRKASQNRFPIQEERICSFLKYLRACGVVAYHRSETRRISSKWDVVDTP